MSSDDVAVALATIDASAQGIDPVLVDHETNQARYDLKVRPKIEWGLRARTGSRLARHSNRNEDARVDASDFI